MTATPTKPHHRRVEVRPFLLVDWYVGTRLDHDNQPCPTLGGAVFDHPGHPQGQLVHTSSPQEVRGSIVRTKRSVYHLDAPMARFADLKLRGVRHPPTFVSVAQLHSLAVDGEIDRELLRQLEADWPESRVRSMEITFASPGGLDVPLAGQDLPPLDEIRLLPLQVRGRDAKEFADGVARRNLELQKQQLATATAEAKTRGKEPFDLDRLEQLCDTSREGRVDPVEDRRARFEYKYYVENPEIMTLAEFASLVDELSKW